MTSGSIPSAVREAAQYWVLRMQSRECDPREREAFERWRRADPAHDAAYREVERVWERSAAEGDDAGMGYIERQSRRRPQERSRPRRRAPGLGIAACLVLAGGPGYDPWRLAQEGPPVRTRTRWKSR